MSYKCPICDSPVHYRKMHKSYALVELVSDTTVIELENENERTAIVFCSKDDSHVFPEDFEDGMIAIAEEFGY